MERFTDSNAKPRPDSGPRSGSGPGGGSLVNTPTNAKSETLNPTDIMAVQAWKRRLACVWSVELLFPGLADAWLIEKRPDLPHEYQSKGRLWTFTFPDEKGQKDCVYAMKCWRGFVDGYMKHRKLRCVRALERGTKSGHYHFHAVTDQFWNAKEVWAYAKKYGFGRVDVIEVDRDRLRYLAKYIAKPRPHWKIPRGVRLWSCVGFRGVKTNRIRFSERTLTVMPNVMEYPYRKSVSWFLDGQLVSRRVITADPIPDAEYRDIEMNITKENIMHIGQLLAGCKILAVGEYRTMTARELNFTDKETQQKKTRKLIEHGIEVGDQQLNVTEWLPDDATLSAVKRPCEKGEPVVVEVSGFSRQWGITAASVKSLASFNGKLS